MSDTRRILVVDDDEAVRDLLDLLLTSQGYSVATAPDGAVALELADRTPPALILLDMRMPGMDGWEFVRRYRQMPAPHAPIVVVTAARDAAGRAAEVNADGYVAKPFDMGELLATVARHAG